MKQNPKQFYTQEKATYEKELIKIKARLRDIAILRFSIFSFTVFLIYFFLGDANKMIVSGIVGSAIFVFFLKKHWKLSKEKKELMALVNINKVELQCLQGDFLDLDTGEEFLDPTHFYSYDIDLFGRGSFFQFINRTKINAGKIKLANLLIQNGVSGIEQKQKAVEELSQYAKWRQKFSAIASLLEIETKPAFIVEWIESYKAFLPKFMHFVPKIVALISVCIITGMFFDVFVFTHLIIWFFIGIGITGVYFKKINDVYRNSTKAKETFQQYYQLLEEIEKMSFSSEILLEKMNNIRSEKLKASQIAKQFSKILDALDQRNNVLVSIVGNGLFLMDIANMAKLEKWIATYKENVTSWFEVVSFFDANNSLANFAFNHPEYAFPEITSDVSVVVAKELGHPLIAASKRITSDCRIDSQQFFIVTGANMAGKSTFLRTISLSIVMANSGLPICASQVKYNPVKLITSMRTSDSLTDEASYFFSELTRLKFIVEALKEEHYFIILDEILKGTNSTDKAQGSQKFVEKLVKSNATGIIATHDLSLCEIEKEYKQIQNYYFDAEIVNDELFFDYTLKKGICQNMNASFLLKKMEIV